jgi:hypothetical protein
MKVIGKGQLAHHVGKDYSATIAIRFGNETFARQSLTILGKTWKLLPKNQKAIYWHGNAEQLSKTMGALWLFGADKTKIAAMNDSEWGEPFQIVLDLLPSQMSFGGPSAPEKLSLDKKYEEDNIRQRTKTITALTLVPKVTATADSYTKYKSTLDKATENTLIEINEFRKRQQEEAFREQAKISSTTKDY